MASTTLSLTASTTHLQKPPVRTERFNWLLQRPAVVNVIMGARNEGQLRQNPGAIGWNLTKEQVAKLDTASDRTPAYPYWHQRQFQNRNPLPTATR